LIAFLEPFHKLCYRLWLVSGWLVWGFYEQAADYCQRIANALFLHSW
jgi:hypothetical protein